MILYAMMIVWATVKTPRRASVEARPTSKNILAKEGGPQDLRGGNVHHENISFCPVKSPSEHGRNEKKPLTLVVLHRISYPDPLLKPPQLE